MFDAGYSMLDVGCWIVDIARVVLLGCHEFSLLKRVAFSPETAATDYIKNNANKRFISG